MADENELYERLGGIEENLKNLPRIEERINYACTQIDKLDDRVDEALHKTEKHEKYFGWLVKGVGGAITGISFILATAWDQIIRLFK